MDNPGDSPSFIITHAIINIKPTPPCKTNKTLKIC